MYVIFSVILIIYSCACISSTIVAVQEITIPFICSFDMRQYPFDVQVCKGTLKPRPNSDVFVKLLPIHDVIYKGTKNLMKYVVTNITFVNNQEVTSRLSF